MLYEKRKRMRIEFYIRFHTSYGESLYILGNVQELGNKQNATMVPMQYMSSDYWKLETDIDITNFNNCLLEYKYFLVNSDGEGVSESGYDRKVDLLDLSGNEVLKVFDVWNYSGAIDNVFFTSPFKNILLPKATAMQAQAEVAPTHLFKVKAPLLKENEVVCILGNDGQLHNWQTNNPLVLHKDGDWWSIPLRLDYARIPLAYKYGVYNTRLNAFVEYESGSNRLCFQPFVESGLVILHDGFINRPNNSWKGAGVSLPVFCLRSENSMGVGEFQDLKLLVDWAKLTGLKLIQLLPVNDTTATYTWKDSYPYAAISAFALHPIFLNIEKVLQKYSALPGEDYASEKKQLNALLDVDYEAVLKLKLKLLQKIYDSSSTQCMESDACREFVQKNKKWLKPYAAFCYLRDKYQTADAAQWKMHKIYNEKEIQKLFRPRSVAYKKLNFYCWLQYQLHEQLCDAVDYAHENGIIIKGDIPIGVYRYGVDAWVAPELYKMHLQAGAPPDQFAATGQNWSFPTYNWEKMQADEFAWWKQRFHQMSHYFDAFRIDHILGFFRIWSIPADAVQGVMGRFDPCLPVHRKEFGENGIWFDRDRYCKPFITDAILYKVFGDKAGEVRKRFLQKSGPNTYALLPEFDTQRKVEIWFAGQDPSVENEQLRSALYNIISNVILFEQEGSDGNEFHFRIAIDQTMSFNYLHEDTKQRLWHLYINYFFHRQDEFWKNESMKKLPGLIEATNMLICGEDLGMVPGCVPDVMTQLGILSLEIQRMPKQPGIEFFNPADAPYLSVVTPSTHDMSTVRGWWQEDRQRTQRFYNTVLDQNGEAPFFCEPWINRAIVLQHLFSPAMWSIFQIQDLMGMDSALRRENPEEERINVPANPNHYWRYRMHISLEKLLQEDAFNKELKGHIKNSGRG